MSVRVRPPTPASRSRTVIARMLESFQERSSVWGGCGGRGSPVVGALVSLWASGVNRGDHGQHCDERDVELGRGIQPHQRSTVMASGSPGAEAMEYSRSAV